MKAEEDPILDGLSDNHLMTAIQTGMDDAQAFSATSEWGFDRLRASVDSRGDTFDRTGAITLEKEGVEIMRIPFSNLPATIGSGVAADYRMEYPGISRLHCLLEPIGCLVRIRDKGATNGVFLNKKRVEFEELCDGDELQLGTVNVRVRIV
ncbi:FHA domain-containing protein [Pontiellaceae bacterium B12227]|nr:FHA domain-containing protein [Pontiellaceae bacterium B12227]